MKVIWIYHKWISFFWWILFFFKTGIVSPILKTFIKVNLVCLLTTDIQTFSFYFILGNSFYTNNFYLSSCSENIEKPEVSDIFKWAKKTLSTWSLLKKCSYSEFFWSVSYGPVKLRIRTLFEQCKLVNRPRRKNFVMRICYTSFSFLILKWLLSLAKLKTSICK